jgi:hypothetical protein
MAEKAQNRLVVPHMVAPYTGKSGGFCHKWPHMGVGFKLAETKVYKESEKCNPQLSSLSATCRIEIR